MTQTEQLPESKIRSKTGTKVIRMMLDPDDTRPDVQCGVNGVAYEKWFRPICVDAEFDAKGLVETRIYGWEVTVGGETGKRWLDHRWHR